MAPFSGPQRAALAAAFAVGAWLRLGALDREGLWLDELFTVRAATRESWAGLLDELAVDVHPPAYFAALKLLVAPGASDAAWRLPSALAGLVTLLAAAALARRLAGNAAAVGAAWLVATAPGLVLLDREARGNAPMAALGLVLLAGTAAGRAPLALALLAAALVNTHLFGAFALVGLAAWVLLDPERATSPRAALGIAAAGAFALLPWAGTLAGQVSRFSADPWYVLPSADALGWIVFALFDERPGLLALAALGLAFAVRAAPRAVTLAVVTAAALVLLPQLLSYAVAPVLRDRSALLLLPVLLVASAAGFTAQGRAGAALLGLLAAAQAAAAWHVTRLDTRREQWREAAALLAAEAAPTDLVLATRVELWRHYLPDRALVDGRTPPGAAASAWVLLAHDVEPEGPLAAALADAPVLRDERFFGARLLRVGPIAPALLFTLPEGAAGRVEGARVELWGNAEATSAPVSVRGACAVELRATEDAAGAEPARLRVRVLDATGALLDETLPVPPAGLLTAAARTPPLPAGTEARVTVAFVNDAVVDGADRNVRVESARLRCE